MSGLDIGLLILALAGAFLGMRIGAVSAFFNILAGFAGSWAASRFHLAVLSAIEMSPSSAYLLVFCATAAALVAAGIVLSHLLQAFFLGLIDKFLGALLGMGLCLALATVALVPLLMEERPALRDLVRRSAFAPYLLRVTQKRLGLNPPDLWGRLDPLLESEQVRRVRRLLEGSR